MPDPNEPDYTLYRSRPRSPFRRADEGELGSLGDRATPHGKRDRDPKQPRDRRPDGVRVHGRRDVDWKRLAKLALLAIVGWGALSVVLFFISATIQAGKTDDAAKANLTGGGWPAVSANTILVLGSDQRVKGTKEPGANTSGPSRSDSILLLRVGGGANRKLSIPRDTVVDIPGGGRQKINAAYAIGGPALAIKTVEQYLGIQINHLVEVNFENFPKFIDALGGITVKTGCVVSRINGGYKNGGYTLRLRSGENHLDGKQALALARTRKNECSKRTLARENDLTRARRQQKIFAAIKDRITSPSTFIRGPWVAWRAPQAVRTDMGGFSLSGLAIALTLSGNGKTQVLKPSGAVTLADGGQGLLVSDDEKRREVRRLLGD